MPIRWEDCEPIEGAPASVRQREITINADEAPEQPEQVSITVTPSSGGYAYTVDTSSEQPAPIFGGKGESVTATMEKLKGAHSLLLSFGAADAASEEASHMISATVRINY